MNDPVLVGEGAINQTKGLEALQGVRPGSETRRNHKVIVACLTQDQGVLEDLEKSFRKLGNGKTIAVSVHLLQFGVPRLQRIVGG